MIFLNKITPESAKIISVIVFAAIMLASGWFGYKNIGQIPALSESDNANDRYASDTTGISPSDLSSDNYSVPVSDSDINKNVQAESPANNLPVEEKVTVKIIKINQATNVRAEDNDNSAKLALLNKDTEVEYVSQSKKRYQIKYAGNKTGWIMKSCGDLSEKEIIVKHIPAYTSGVPLQMKGTKEGDEIGSILKNYSTTGASVAVIKNGQVAYHYEYGYANKQKKVKVNENTKFRIASATKVFTSMLAMAEVDDEKLDLDGDLSKIMGYKFYNPSYPKQKVTMRMLLTHTSGLIDRDNQFSQKLKNITCNGTYYVSPPGVKFLYCNLNLGIAGAVVEKSANQTISQYAADRFFTPMGIDASYDAKYLSDSSLVAECYSGDKVNCSNKYLCRSQEKGAPGVTFHLGQGGLLISAEDLARVLSVLINDGQYEGKQYLSQKSLDEMLTDQKIETNKDFQQCIGIRQSKEVVDGRNMYFHNGAAYGIFSLVAFDPADKSGLVIITSGAFTPRNKNTVFAVCDDVLNYVYDEVLKQ